MNPEKLNVHVLFYVLKENFLMLFQKKFEENHQPWFYASEHPLMVAPWKTNLYSEFKILPPTRNASNQNKSQMCNLFQIWPFRLIPTPGAWCTQCSVTSVDQLVTNVRGSEDTDKGKDTLMCVTHSLTDHFF